MSDMEEVVEFCEGCEHSLACSIQKKTFPACMGVIEPNTEKEA